MKSRLSQTHCGRRVCIRSGGLARTLRCRVICFLMGIDTSVFVSAGVADAVDGWFISTSREITFVVALFSWLPDDCNWLESWQSVSSSGQEPWTLFVFIDACSDGPAWPNSTSFALTLVTTFGLKSDSLPHHQSRSREHPPCSRTSVMMIHTELLSGHV